MRRKLLSILALLCLTVTSAWADGSCGNGLTWTLSSGTLTISKTGEGDGAMVDCSDGSHSPWFNSRGEITSVVIGDGVTSISAWAFSHRDQSYYTNLTSLTIGKDVTSIGEHAFEGCTGLTSVVIPNSVQTISAHVFKYCSNVTSLTIGSGVTYIGDNAFMGLGITSLVIPANVQIIINGVFRDCTQLSTVVVEATSLSSYGVAGFENNATGRKIFVPDASVSTFKSGWNAYADDIKGYSEISGSNVGTCGATGNESNVVYALTGTSPNYTLNICGNGAMKDYSDDATLPWRSSTSNITSVVVGSGVTTIGQNAFWTCSNLSSITFAENSQLEYINPNAFYGCTGLASITLPASVKGISHSVFSTCSNLSSITLNSNPLIGTPTFPAGATIRMDLPGNEGATNEFWMTFYNQNYNFQAPSGTQIFKAALTGTALALTPLETDKIITKNSPVILKSTTGPISLTLTSTDSGNDFSIADGKTGLTGVSDPAGKAADGSTYVLNKKAGTGVGFYKLADGKKVGVGKAYITYTTSAPELDYLEFTYGDGITTEITTTNFTDYTDKSGAWYSLDGRRIANDQEPTAKGLYIHNGKKVIIK